MSITKEEGRPAAQRRTQLAWVGLLLLACAITGTLVPAAGYFVPMLLVLGVVGFLGAIGLFSVFGIEGGLLVAATIMSFLLMQRFDEGLAVPLGEFEFRGFYTVTSLLFAALFLIVAARNLTDTMAGQDGRAFAARFMGLWTAFAFSGTFTILVNQVFDEYVPERSLLGELLAWYAILMPMLFLPLALGSRISHRRALWCLHAMVGLGGLAGLVLSAFGILPGQILGALGWQGTIQGTTDLVRGRLPLGHPNHVAAVMNMLLPIALVYGFLGRGWMWRLLHLGCAFFMLCGVLFALSRGALLNMAVVIVVTLAYVFLTRENRRWYTPFLMAGALMVSLVVPLILFQTYDFSRFWSRGYYEDASVERRAESMSTALAVWMDYPIRGASPNAVYPRLELHGSDWEPDFGDSISPVVYYRGLPTAETPHNLFLIVPAEFGLVGAVIFFGMFAYMAWVLLRARRLPGIDRMDRQLIAAFVFSLGGLLLSGMFEAILFAGMRVNVIFWVLFGVAFVYTFQAVANRKPDSGATP
jgi:O-antigen ligase